MLPFTVLLNKLFAVPAVALMHLFGAHPHNPAAPIPNFVAMEILVALVLIVFFALVRATLSVDKPGALQHLMEGIDGFIKNQSHELIGHGYETFTSYLVVLGCFILLCNLIGLVPAFEAPTATPAVPLGCALVTFVYYHFHGIKRQGGHYIKQFIGPVWWLAPLMLIIEICSHVARVMSLTIRLFANIFAGDMVTLAFFSLIPLGFPIIFLGLHLGVSFIQTYIFVLLTTVYLAGAVAEEH